jgi:hypothetical protein
VSFDFRQIVGPEDSKADNFSALCSRLIIRLNPEAKPVDGKGGDEGLDTYIGIFNGQCRAFQHKYFPERVGKSQRAQVEKSLVTATKKHSIKCWTLMLPINLSPDEIRWFQGLQKKYRPLAMDWWGKDKLCELLTGHRDNWRTKLSKDLHRNLFRGWLLRETETSTLNVHGVLDTLEKEFQAVGFRYDVAITPHCSKMQAIALYLFWRRHPEVQIVFTTPVRFNAKHYSRGSGQTFEFSLQECLSGTRADPRLNAE